MKDELKCGICGKKAKVHGYQRATTLYYHYQTEHPEEFAEIKQACQDYRDILKKHKWQESNRIFGL